MKKILLVEDTAHLAEELVDILTMEGFHVDLATNGLEGIAFLSNNLPDLIITDLLMPKMDGFEFIEKVRSKSETSSIPIVVLSAKTSDVERKKVEEIGANKFIPKPCKAHELVSCVKSLL
ncbi:MAG: response regulator transcription factor [Cyclobacteriaceae bacterium]|nr:response regulator transcription factor [Cyclobacteriaceae bacterium]